MQHQKLVFPINHRKIGQYIQVPISYLLNSGKAEEACRETGCLPKILLNQNAERTHQESPEV